MEEYIDALNPDGTLTGVKKTRKEIHRSGDWHRTVHVWIINSQGEILTQLRSHSKEQDPNKWDLSAAGHISAGDDSKTSVLREVEEELGLDVSRDELNYIAETSSSEVLNDGSYIDNELHDIYIIYKDLDMKDVVLQKEEVADVRWIKCEDMEKDIKENPTKYVDQGEEFGLVFDYIRKHKR